MVFPFTSSSQPKHNVDVDSSKVDPLFQHIFVGMGLGKLTTHYKIMRHQLLFCKMSQGRKARTVASNSIVGLVDFGVTQDHFT